MNIERFPQQINISRARQILDRNYPYTITKDSIAVFTFCLWALNLCTSEAFNSNTDRFMYTSIQPNRFAQAETFRDHRFVMKWGRNAISMYISFENIGLSSLGVDHLSSGGVVRIEKEILFGASLKKKIKPNGESAKIPIAKIRTKPPRWLIVSPLKIYCRSIYKCYCKIMRLRAPWAWLLQVINANLVLKQYIFLLIWIKCDQK